MIGLQYLRNKLEYSGEKFGNLCDVSKATISKWESKDQAIPRKKLLILADIFNCSPNVFCGDVDGDDSLKTQLIEIARRYVIQKDIDDARNLLMALQSENEIIQHENEVRQLISLIKGDPELMEVVQRVERIRQTRNGKKVLGLFLAVSEEYLALPKGFHPLKIGNSDYASGKIRKDDALIMALINVLDLGLKINNGEKERC